MRYDGLKARLLQHKRLYVEAASRPTVHLAMVRVLPVIVTCSPETSVIFG